MMTPVLIATFFLMALRLFMAMLLALKKHELHDFHKVSILLGKSSPAASAEKRKFNSNTEGGNELFVTTIARDYIFSKVSVGLNALCSDVRG